MLGTPNWKAIGNLGYEEPKTFQNNSSFRITGMNRYIHLPSRCMNRWILWFTLTLSPFGAIWGFDATHASWGTLLKRHTHEGLVDYLALKKSPTSLQTYLDSLANVSSKAFEDWSNENQLAFLINLYNAATIRLILDEYPIQSIQDETC